MATPLPPQSTPPSPTADDHLVTLIELAEHFEQALSHFVRDGARADKGIAAKYAKRAAAIRWILAETAHGVTEGEVVT